MTNLEELKSQIMVVPFVDIEPHLKRDAVVVIDESLELADIGKVLIDDNKDHLQKLIDQGLVTKASPLDFESWRKQKQFFKILIVQPFVLVQNFVQLNQPPAN